MKIASKGYLNSLELNCIDSLDGRTIIPKESIVAAVKFARERIYPWCDQVLHDYHVAYVDGTTDCRSYGPDQGLPTVGEFHHRGMALCGGDFCTWIDDQAECHDGVRISDRLPSHHERKKSTSAHKPVSWETRLRRELAERKRLFDIENKKPF